MRVSRAQTSTSVSGYKSKSVRKLALHRSCTDYEPEYNGGALGNATDFFVKDPCEQSIGDEFAHVVKSSAHVQFLNAFQRCSKLKWLPLLCSANIYSHKFLRERSQGRYRQVVGDEDSRVYVANQAYKPWKADNTESAFQSGSFQSGSCNARISTPSY